MTAKILQMRHCQGCGINENDCAVLVAIPNAFICEICIERMATIVAHQAPEKARITFVDHMVEIMREPIEIVAKWKEIRARDAALSDSKDAK